MEGGWLHERSQRTIQMHCQGKAANRRYVHSPKGKATRARYARSAKAKAWRKQCGRSPRRQGSEGKSYGAIQSKTSKARSRYNNSLTPIRWRSGGTPTRKYVITSFAVGWGERHTQTLQRTSS